MRKSFVMIVALALVAALAVPAMAEVNLTGFYRAKGYMTNFLIGKAGDPTGTAGSPPTATSAVQIGKDAPTASYVDQRFRAKVSIGDENVKAVYFGELNELWGQDSSGGGIGADGTSQLKTKNLYLWFKVPETPVDVTAGIQNVTDAYAGVFFGAADMAGVFANVKASDALALRLGWGQIQNNSVVKDQNVNLYVAEAKFGVAKDVNVGANLYFLRDAGNTFIAADGVGKMYMPGVNVTAKVNDMVGLTGFVFGQFGDFKPSAPGSVKTKFQGVAGDVRADLAAGPAKVFVEGLYTSGDSTADDKYKGIVVIDNYKFGMGSSTFNRTDLYILHPAADSIGTAGALTYNMDNRGKGVTLLAAGATMPITPKLTGKVGVGYLGATKVATGSKGMGTEVNAVATYNVTKGLDASLAGAYCLIGSYFDGVNNTGNGKVGDPDDPYTVYAKLNYAF